MVPRFKLEFMLLQACFCLSTVATFFMLQNLKKKKYHTSFSQALCQVRRIFSVHELKIVKSGGQKLIRQPPYFCITRNGLQWPPMISNAGAAPKCLKHSHSKIKIKNSKKKFQKFFLFTTNNRFIIRKKNSWIFFSHFLPVGLSKWSGFIVRTLYIRYVPFSK